MSTEPTPNGIDFKKIIATGIVTGITFVGVTAILKRFFKAEE